MRDNISSNELRRNFIAMLFALVVATLAQRFSDILFLITEGWSISIISLQIFQNLFANELLLLAPLTHASLGLILVSASWVGWSKSQAAGHQEPINKLFSFPFILLLIEVMLVTLYFGIAVSIEIEVDSYTYYKSGSKAVPQPSALPESMQLLAIFLIYFVWDVIADVWRSPLGAREGSDFTIRPHHKILSIGTGPLTYGFSSLLCMLLCFLIALAHTDQTSASQAVYGDLALIAVIAVFYSSKCLEAYTTRIFPWEGTRRNSIREGNISTKQITKLALSATFFVILITILCATN